LSGNDSEVCWALWLAKEAGLSIELEVLERILDRCGAMSALLAIDVYQSSHHSFSFPKAKLLDRIGDQPMMGENWLLSYEADRLFGFKLKTKNLIGNSFFEELYNNDTEFYDADALPVAFLGKEDPSEVASALEDITSYYDGEYMIEHGDEEYTFQDDEEDHGVL